MSVCKDLQQVRRFVLNGHSQPVSPKYWWLRLFSFSPRLESSVYGWFPSDLLIVQFTNDGIKEALQCPDVCVNPAKANSGLLKDLCFVFEGRFNELEFGSSVVVKRQENVLAAD